MSFSMMIMTSMIAMAVPDVAPPSCATEIQAESYARRLADIPPEIRDDLNSLTKGTVGDSGGPLLATDAPSAVERQYPTTRFYQAFLIKNQWFVQFEVAMFAGVRTMTYRRSKDNNRFYRSPWGYFGGPACESLNAALSGVTTPPDGWS